MIANTASKDQKWRERIRESTCFISRRIRESCRSVIPDIDSNRNWFE